MELNKIFWETVRDQYQASASKESYYICEHSPTFKEAWNKHHEAIRKLALNFLFENKLRSVAYVGEIFLFLGTPDADYLDRFELRKKFLDYACNQYRAF
jgi:hypothetical protein